MFAHAGRIVTVDERAEEALDRCAAYPTIFTDSSMVTDTAVLVAVLQAFGPERMLQLSRPFSLLRYRDIHPPEGGSVAVSAHPYHWQRPDRVRRLGPPGRGCTARPLSVPGGAPRVDRRGG